MKTVTIGRNAGNDVVLSDPYVSGKHAYIVQNDDGSFAISDLGSRNGTFVNGHKITQSVLHYNDIVKLGEYVIPWQQYFQPQTTSVKGSVIKTYSIGRSAENDIVIADEYASSKHAFLSITNQNQAFIQDNSSTNGTFVNNLRVDSCVLQAGDELKIARTIMPWMQYLQHTHENHPSKLKKKTNIGVILAIVFSSMILVAVTTWFIGSKTGLFQSSKTDSLSGDIIPSFSNLKDLAKYAEKAVFLVETQNNSGNPIKFGTGFFISQKGIGITNAHVLDGGSSFKIKSNRGELYDVSEVIKINNTYDYAIFRVEAVSDITILKISDESPEKGQDICVLGNPQGIESTLTKGIISGFKGGTEKEIMNGKFSDGTSFIQMDVAISHGSSGSPVMNMKGEVIGIATLSFAEANCVNCNFAVNIDNLKGDLRDLGIIGNRK